ncbi:MAG: immunoglobulin domain-containing protein, partial [Verrucomicrobia bacterium]|nr:immunoglobulin domain-containing protein [Verrucomicrobiota bacterium]
MNRNSIKTAGIFAMLLSVSFFFVPTLFAAADSVEGDGLIYQWYKNGKAIFGATGPEYTIESADETDIGTYTVKVINRVGEEISMEAELTVEGAV